MKEKLAAAKRFTQTHAADINLAVTFATLTTLGIIAGYDLGKRKAAVDHRLVHAYGKVIENETSDTLTVYVEKRNGELKAFDWIISKEQ